MMNDILDGAKAKRLPFEVLVTLHGDRLGRDQVRTNYAVDESYLRRRADTPLKTGGLASVR